ncbi:hypothetical protein SOVF_176300, partial [Spinacia oleracea]
FCHLLGGVYARDRVNGYEKVDMKIQNERIGKLFGRKGGLGSSHNAEGVELYGVDMIGAAERIKHIAEDNEESDVGSSFPEGNDDEDEEPSLDDYNKALDLTDLGEIGEKIQENKTNASTRNEGSPLMKASTTEVESLVSFGAVILKKNDKEYEVFRFNDETGVPKYESAPSRRSDIQVENSLKGRLVNSSNCQKLSKQKNAEKQRLNKSEELKDLTVVESGKGSIRELLQNEGSSSVAAILFVRSQ